MKKISFLIAVHNEEKIIEKTLTHLLSIPYNNYEIIIGLDGCTDNTKKIVEEFKKKSDKVKMFSLNLRMGKPAVINEIIKKSTGEIIIINDADWLFNIESSGKLLKFISVFDDPRVGGIAESFPVEWDEQKIKKGNLGYKMTAYGAYFWMEFQREKYAFKKNRIFYLKEPTMFLTNILRKELYKPNDSLGDDFERTADIMNQGYDVVTFDDISIPRMTSVYDKIYIKDIFNQKVRTAKARKQIKNKGQKIGAFYNLKAGLSIIKRAFKHSLVVGMLVTTWLAITFIASLKSGLLNFDTKKGWTLRAQR